MTTQLSVPAKSLRAFTFVCAALAIALLSPGVAAGSTRDRIAKSPPTTCSVGLSSASCARPARQAPTPEEELASRYAPIVQLGEQEADCDSGGEAFEPVAVEFLFDNTDIVLKQDAPDQPVVAVGPSVSDLYQGGDDLYLDFPGNPRRPDCEYEDYFIENGAGHARVAYAHIVREPGFEELVLQYWFFYYFNDWNNTHEGDWELIQLVFEAQSAAEALEREPLRVAYSQHNGGETADWDDDKLEREGRRPVVYPARGAHSNFYDQATFFGKGEEGTGFGCDDAGPPSRRVELEARLVPDEVMGPSDPFAWITYEGRWGERQRGEFNGPTGPNTKERWSQPLTWQEGLRGSSLQVPDGTLGPNAIEAFCAVVATGSDLLLRSAPFVVLGLAAVAVGSLAVTVRRTRFRPVLAEPLAQRRHFGQIVRSAFAVQRQRPGLFLGIGALFVPLGVITAAVQTLVLANPPVEPVLEVMDAAAASGILALAVGALQFGIAYWLVLGAVIAALGELSTGRRTGIVDAYRMLGHRLWTLARARLAALLIVTLLSVTIIGIPWALRQAVRWTFLEQAILLEGAGGRDARRASSRLVAGNWWRTLGITAVIAFTGIASGPVIGMAILLLTSAPLVFINVISSLVYVALIPYVAIALTMLYFDLRLAHETSPDASEA